MQISRHPLGQPHKHQDLFALHLSPSGSPVKHSYNETILDFTVVTASHGKEALELLKTAKNGSGFDAILTDEQMPSVSSPGIQRSYSSEGNPCIEQHHNNV